MMKRNHVYTYAEYCELIGWDWLGAMGKASHYHRCDVMDLVKFWIRITYRGASMWMLDVPNADFLNKRVWACPFCGVELPEV